MLTTHIKNANDTYGPTPKNSFFYQPKEDHGLNSHNARKTKWCIKESEEISVFIIAESDNHLFCEKNQCYFSIVNNGSFVLGKTGERIAKFPSPPEGTNTWHGYPVKCEKDWNTPGDKLLDEMLAANVINGVTRRRIERRKI